jgi:hypothetical protein
LKKCKTFILGFSLSDIKVDSKNDVFLFWFLIWFDVYWMESKKDVEVGNKACHGVGTIREKQALLG